MGEEGGDIVLSGCDDGMVFFNTFLLNSDGGANAFASWQSDRNNVPIAASAAKRRRGSRLLLRWRGGEKEIIMVAAMRGINVDDDVEEDNVDD